MNGESSAILVTGPTLGFPQPTRLRHRGAPQPISHKYQQLHSYKKNHGSKGAKAIIDDLERLPRAFLGYVYLRCPPRP